MNNDELQKAIDDITNNNAAAQDAAPVVDAAAENEQLANEMVQPSAPVTGAGVDLAPTAPEVDLGTAPAPAVPEMPAMPPAPEAAQEPAIAPEPVAVTSAVEEAASEVDETAPAASDDTTLNEAYKELYPLLDKVEMPVEEKFEITLKFGEPSEALVFAKNIADETLKAKALMKLIEKLK